MIGASWWTYNDYQSRHQGTNPNGYRPWGIVRPDRTPRPAYKTYQREMTPVTLGKTTFQIGEHGQHALTLKVTARNDFPAYAIQGYYLKTADKTFPIPNLNPGESREITIPVTGFDKNLDVQIYKPTGFKIVDETFELK